ncbi:MoaD/ThiS family protein [Brevibacterium aurantiacum]|uniref:Molybdopterin synthase sulfur carrier subunit n=1 Tax=Brevibacterium aurantiacum TaxID=273384 RepID=A0A2A3ZDF8_BREAU|nr:MoaD/ThiS family protein [Brevibacterium aurantiacum]PCC49385.1 molybdopterin synthase sulfur carrier subunit [Brevibacterium aurantiacum]
MPQIRVRFFAAAREAFGTKESTAAASTIDELMTTLTKDASTETTTVISRSSFLVNAVAATDPQAPLSEGDTVDVLPPFAGG